MKNNLLKAFLFSALFYGISSVNAQETPKPHQLNYNYHDAFAPLFYTKNGTIPVRQADSQVQNIGKTEQIIN